jgi:hypothetical protein
MIKSLLAGAALAVAASASIAAGDTVSVSYDAYFEGNVLWYVGTFTGTDTNNDGTLSFSELTSFVATQKGGDPSLTLSDLSGFGDFSIATDTWHNNGVIQAGYADSAYITWNNGGNALATFDQAAVTTTITSLTSAVPEPTTLAMMGLGALALVVRRKRQSA